VAGLRHTDEDDLEEIHFVFVVDDEGRLTGRLPLVRLLLTRPAARVRDVMEADPLYVEVGLDQEEVASFFRIHDLISVPVVDDQRRLVGKITADDVLDVMEEEATEDISRLAGVSVEEFGEQSSFRVARSRLPWLLGALFGQMGAVMVMSHFEQSLQATVALAFYTPMIMGTAGNIGIQTSSVVVRGLATGEVDFFHLGRHLMREMGTAVVTGVAVAVAIFLLSLVISGQTSLSLVLGVSMLLVILFAAMAGSGIPLLLHRFGIDPAVATGPFITTANDIFSMLIYLGLATLMLSQAGAG
jgi:magnesium transporter